MNVGSLFSGIGGFDLGLERAGMRVAWHCEADEFCRRVLARHWPGVPCYPDVRDLRAIDIEPVDVLCGGFPCQDISVAGKGAGIEGERSGLWSEYARLVGELRPRYVIVENVSALLSRGLGRVLGDLAALGYDAEWDCIPASALGAPHQRDRVWIVAYPQGWRGQGEQERADARGPLVGAVAGPSGRVVDGDSSSGVRLVGAGASGSDGRGAPLADTEREGQLQPEGLKREVGRWLGDRSREGDLADADSQRRQRAGRISESPGRAESALGRARELGDAWATEPDVGRMAHGVPARVDRLRALGNALVPQIAEWLGGRILDWEDSVTL